MYHLIALCSLIIAIVATFSAMKGKHQFYWVAAIGIYIFSFIASFSIGQIVVGLTLIPLTLAIGYSFGWIKNKTHSNYFLFLGILIGVILVAFVDDAWLFFPFRFLI